MLYILYIGSAQCRATNWTDTMSTATVYHVNAAGLAEIHDFLGRAHKLGRDHFTPAMLRAWADAAEFQLGEGNPARIEVRAHDHIMGWAEEFEISAVGLDCEKVEID